MLNMEAKLYILSRVHTKDKHLDQTQAYMGHATAKCTLNRNHATLHNCTPSLSGSRALGKATLWV